MVPSRVRSTPNAIKSQNWLIKTKSNYPQNIDSNYFDFRFTVSWLAVSFYHYDMWVNVCISNFLAKMFRTVITLQNIYRKHLRSYIAKHSHVKIPNVLVQVLKVAVLSSLIWYPTKCNNSVRLRCYLHVIYTIAYWFYYYWLSNLTIFDRAIKLIWNINSFRHY